MYVGMCMNAHARHGMYVQKNILLILVISAGTRFYLPFSDWFEPNGESRVRSQFFCVYISSRMWYIQQNKQIIEKEKIHINNCMRNFKLIS